MDVLEVLGQKIGCHRLLINGRILKIVTRQAEAFPSAHYVDSLGSSSAQVNGNNLIAPFGLAAKKWQTHIKVLFSRRSANRVRRKDANSFSEPEFGSFCHEQKAHRP